jgi:HEAT repeat protein
LWAERLGCALFKRVEWKKAAVDLGMTFSPRLSPKLRQSLGVPGRLRFAIVGRRGSFKVTICECIPDHLWWGNPGRYILVEIDGDGRIPPQLGLYAHTRKLPSIETADEHFDQRARVSGSEPVALAALNNVTRAAVLKLLQDGGAVHESRVTFPCPTLYKATVFLPWLVELAEQLSLRKVEIPQALADNAFNDPVPKVRARSFVALQQHFPDSAIARQVLDQALASESSELRLEAALVMREEGKELLSEMALAADISPTLRLRAVDRLTRASWAQTTIPVLEQLLSCEVTAVRRAAIFGLGRYRHRPAVARLLALDRSDSATAGSIAEALGRIGDPAAEPTLVDLLSHDDIEVATAAASALGWVGTPAAVEPLQEIAGKRRHKDLRQAAGESIQRVQNRITGAEQGQLSLVQLNAAEGALSRAGDAAGGEVSLVGEPPESGP